MKIMEILVGGAIGAIALPLTYSLLHWIFERGLFKDGQYCILYFFYIPQGAWLGALTGFGLASGHSKHHHVGIMLLIGSALLVIPSLLFSFSDRNGTWGRVVGFFGLALIWALVLIIWGIGLLWTRS